MNWNLPVEVAPKAVEADADEAVETRSVDEWGAVDRTELNKLRQEMWT